MLQLNGIKCWITSSNLTPLPLTSTHDDSSRIVTCTVKMPTSRKSYIIHWSSSSPITAWCEVNIKNALGRTTEGVVKCEMDANDPSTQTRSTQEYNGTGRNLSFSGRRPLSSQYLGMAWLEIRRATSIDVNEVSSKERKLTIHWLPSDRPDSGTPYVTFMFNFELCEQAINNHNGPTASPITPSPRKHLAIRSSTPEEQAQNSVSECDELSSPPVATFNTSAIEKLDQPVIVDPVTANTEKPEAPVQELAQEPMIIESEVAKEPVVKELGEAGRPIEVNDDAASVTPPITVETEVTSEVEELSNGSHKRTCEELQSEDLPETKRLRSDVVAPATQDQEMIPELLADVSDEEADDFNPKIESIDTEIETFNKNLERISKKKEYLEVKHKRVQSIIDIQSLETICGPLASKRPTQDKWDTIESENFDDDKEYSERRRQMEEALPSLDCYLSALRSKQIYLEKKAKLKRLKLDFEAIEKRCNQLSADISAAVSKSPTKTPIKTSTKTPIETPVKASTQTPIGTPVRASTQTPAGTPIETPTKPPKTLAQLFARHTNNTPIKTTAQTAIKQLAPKRAPIILPPKCP